MRILLLLSVNLFIVQVYFSQSWTQPHHLINIPNKPSKVSLGDIVAVNGGNQIGNSSIPNAGVIKTLRDFYHMEIDYDYSYFPTDGILNPNTCDCSNTWCNNGNCNDFFVGSGTKSSFGSKKDFYCSWNSSGYQFDEIYSTLESIFPKRSSGGCTSTDITRGYPDKWYSLSEWGGITNIEQNFANYLLPFITTYCPTDTSKPCLIDVLEIGNEPWGANYPGEAGYHKMLDAAVSTFTSYYGSNNPKDWRMKLSTAALEAHDSVPNNFGATEMYIEDMVPASVRPYFDYVNIHPYAFPLDNSFFGVNQRPESENGAFLTLKNMVEWRNNQMSHAKVNVTEFGWNAGTPGDGCGPLGESTQAAYIMRAFLLAARNDVHRAFVYAMTDASEYPLYCTIGLYEDLSGNNPRKAFEAIQKMKSSTIGDKHFLKALTETADQPGDGINGIYAYLFGDELGNPTHLVAWRPDSLSYENTNYPTNASTYSTINLPDTILKINNGDSYYTLGWDNSQDGLISNTGSGVVDITGVSSNSVKVKLSAVPVVIPLQPNGCIYDSLGVLSCGGSANIVEERKELIVNVYPNPTNDLLNIRLNNVSVNSKVEISLLSVSGRLIQQKKQALNNGISTLSTNNLINGSYLLQINTADGKMVNKRFNVLK